MAGVESTQGNTGTEPLTPEAAADEFAGLLSDADFEDTQKPTSSTDDDADEADIDGEEADTDDTDVEADDDVDGEPDEDGLVEITNEDGSKERVTPEERDKGYLRTADYTRKTQAVAEARKEADAERSAVRAERTQVVALLKELESATKIAEPDWDAIAQSRTPEEFAAIHAHWQIKQREHDSIVAERQRQEQRNAEDGKRQLEQHVAEESEKLSKAVPEWKNPKAKAADLAAMRETATALGFTDNDLKGIVDHRIMRLLRLAAKQQTLEKQAPTVEQRIRRTKTVNPGSSSKNVSRNEAAASKAYRSFAQTGTKQAAAAVFAEVFG